MSVTFRSKVRAILTCRGQSLLHKRVFVTSPATEDKKPASHQLCSWLWWSPPLVYQKHVNRHKESLGGEWSGPVFMGSVPDPPSEAAKGFLKPSALLEEVLGSETHLQPNIPR